MHYGIETPNFGTFSDLSLLVGMAQEAEQAGWNGFFIWDHITLGTFPVPMADPWVALTAIAAKTTRIKLGPMVTPLPRRRPWKVAREAVSLDHLSGGRLILGIGAGTGYAWDQLGEATDPRVRAIMLDEGLEILAGLWQGELYSHNGVYYKVKDVVFLPPPLQVPRIPIWLGAVWPKKPPLRRAARWDGVVPTAGSYASALAPEAIRDMSSYMKAHRQHEGPFEVVVRGLRTTGEDPARDNALLAAYEDAGGTWWFENVLFGEEPGWSVAAARERIRKGPPRG